MAVRMSVSSGSLEEEVVKKMKRRSSFAPGRRSLVPNVVSDTESDEGSNDSLTEEKMLTGIINEVIAEHKQEQADWNNFMKREKKTTEDFLNQPDIVLTFSSTDEPAHLSANHRDIIAKSRDKLDRHRETLRQLRGRARIADAELDKAVLGIEVAAANRQRQVDEAMESRRRKTSAEGEGEEQRTSRQCIQSLLASDDSGIGVEMTSNNNNNTMDSKI